MLDATKIAAIAMPGQITRHAVAAHVAPRATPITRSAEDAGTSASRARTAPPTSDDEDARRRARI